MTPRRFMLVAAVLLAVAVPGPLRGQAPAVDSDAARQARLTWFREAKYGLFIHWGLYAIPAGEWQGTDVSGYRRVDHVPRPHSRCASTRSSRQQFNPTKFDADAIVRLAKDAGMKYIVITSKHHDGFALFDSKVSPYDAVDATPGQARPRSRNWPTRAGSRACGSASTTRRRRTGTSRTARGTPGTSAPTTRRTSTSTCATRRSRRCASCSRSTAPSR